MNIDVAPKYQDTCYNSPNVSNKQPNAQTPSYVPIRICNVLYRAAEDSCLLMHRPEQCNANS